MAETLYDVLQVFDSTNNNCQYLYSLNVNDVAGDRLKDGHYLVLEKGLRDTGNNLDMCKAEILGSYYYVWVDNLARSRLLRMTLAEYESHTVAQHTLDNENYQTDMYTEIKQAADARAAKAEEDAAAAQALVEAAGNARHNAEEDTRRIDLKIAGAETDANQRIAAFTQSTLQSMEAERQAARKRADMIAADTDGKIEKMKAEQSKKLNVLVARLDKMRDPVTGRLRPVEDITEGLYNLHREEGLTAAEYDALNLTGVAFAAYALTANQYATKGKTLLV